MTLPIVNDQSFKNWLRKQPPDKKYAYADNRNCCICQYFKSYGFTEVSVSSTLYFPEGTNHGAKALPEGWDYIARGYDDETDPRDILDGRFLRTMGDAFRRAEEVFA